MQALIPLVAADTDPSVLLDVGVSALACQQGGHTQPLASVRAAEEAAAFHDLRTVLVARWELTWYGPSPATARIHVLRQVRGG